MAYDFLITTWKDSVRRVCGGVTVADVPDTLLEDDLYAVASEDWIKRKITDWTTVKVTKSKELNRAAIYHIASKICGYLLKKLFQSETIAESGSYSYQLQQIDWTEEANKNLALCYEYMDLAKPETIGTMTMIDKIVRSEPIYEPLEWVEE
jgi:hypothetical protein